jgi:hypothetical protein
MIKHKMLHSFAEKLLEIRRSPCSLDFSYFFSVHHRAALAALEKPPKGFNNGMAEASKRATDDDELSRAPKRFKGC